MMKVFINLFSMIEFDDACATLLCGGRVTPLCKRLSRQLKIHKRCFTNRASLFENDLKNICLV